MADNAKKFGIYCAIDFADGAAALSLAQKIAPYVAGFKLGLEYFTANGMAGVKTMQNLGLPIFLDLKLHDIDNTVYATMKNIAAMGVDFTTIHASGGGKMIKAACDGAREGFQIGLNQLGNSQLGHSQFGQQPPAIIAVTILTSISQQDFTQMNSQKTIAEQVLALSELALAHGADGLVSSGHEIAAIRQKFGHKPILVVPGLRPESADKNDQMRVMTPPQAWQLGGNLLVVGRPITQAQDPAHAARIISQSINTQ